MKIEKIPEGYLLARKGGNGCELWRKFNGAESLACDAIDELIAERDALRALVATLRSEISALRTKIEQMEQQEPVAKARVHQIGAGGYRDIGTDLTDDALAAIHMLGIIRTYGVDGCLPAQPALSVPDDWMQHAARMAALARKLREPDWHFESIREMQRELCALEDAALAAASEAKT